MGQSAFSQVCRTWTKIQKKLALCTLMPQKNSQQQNPSLLSRSSLSACDATSARLPLHLPACGFLFMSSRHRAIYFQFKNRFLLCNNPARIRGRQWNNPLLLPFSSRYLTWPLPTDRFLALPPDRQVCVSVRYRGKEPYVALSQWVAMRIGFVK